MVARPGHRLGRELMKRAKVLFASFQFLFQGLLSLLLAINLIPAK
jgi:hypothetical protein